MWRVAGASRAGARASVRTQGCVSSRQRHSRRVAEGQGGSRDHGSVMLTRAARCVQALQQRAALLQQLPAHVRADGLLCRC